MSPETEPDREPEPEAASNWPIVLGVLGWVALLAVVIALDLFTDFRFLRSP